MTSIKFNHDVELIHSSLGISNERADELTATVMYEMINQQFVVKQLYDSPEEAPRDLTTKTGVIEKILKNTTNEAENLLVMWEYSKLETLIQNSDSHRDKIIMMTGMMYMMSDRKKEPFIKEYIKRKKQVQEENEEENED